MSQKTTAGKNTESSTYHVYAWIQAYSPQSKLHSALAMSEEGRIVWRAEGRTAQQAISSLLLTGMGHIWEHAPEGFTLRVILCPIEAQACAGLLKAVEKHKLTMGEASFVGNNIVEGEVDE